MVVCAWVGEEVVIVGNGEARELFVWLERLIADNQYSVRVPLMDYWLLGGHREGGKEGRRKWRR